MGTVGDGWGRMGRVGDGWGHAVTIVVVGVVIMPLRKRNRVACRRKGKKK